MRKVIAVIATALLGACQQYPQPSSTAPVATAPPTDLGCMQTINVKCGSTVAVWPPAESPAPPASARTSVARRTTVVSSRTAVVATPPADAPPIPVSTTRGANVDFGLGRPVWMPAESFAKNITGTQPTFTMTYRQEKPECSAVRAVAPGAVTRGTAIVDGEHEPGCIINRGPRKK